MGEGREKKTTTKKPLSKTRVYLEKIYCVFPAFLMLKEKARHFISLNRLESGSIRVDNRATFSHAPKNHFRDSVKPLASADLHVARQNSR